MKDTDLNNYNQLKRLYNETFSLRYLGNDISSKFALISLIAYIVTKLKEKKPNVTYYQVIYKIANGIVPQDCIELLSIICEDFAYGCTEFPTFGLKDSEIPNKIKEILLQWVPF